MFLIVNIIGFLFLLKDILTKKLIFLPLFNHLNVIPDLYDSSAEHKSFVIECFGHIVKVNVIFGDLACMEQHETLLNDRV